MAPGRGDRLHERIWLSTTVVLLLGAELDAEMEHRERPPDQRSGAGQARRFVGQQATESAVSGVSVKADEAALLRNNLDENGGNQPEVAAGSEVMIVSII
jgi:hypothetical protein